MKDLKYYLNLPYSVVLRPDGEGSIVARVEELPGCATDAPTAQEALERLDELKQAWIEDAIEAGHTVPEPQAEEVLPSGKWVQRVPRSLHRKLSLAAEKEGVSLNSYVSSILSEAIGLSRAVESSVVPGVEFAFGSEERQTASIWHQSLTGWAQATENFQSIVTVHSAKTTGTQLSLENQLQILGAGLSRNERKIPLMEIYDDQTKQKLGKAC